ncbi:hypothetical protein DV736_g1039, partial [Chaetothyriales sp. CBS 134916]
MAVDSSALVKALHAVLLEVGQDAYPHVPNPPGCEKRASVAVIVRVRPPFTPLQPPAGSTVSVDRPEAPASSVNHFFSKQWVQDGDPEILFIKRAGRAGDRWSGHTALPGGKRDPGDADDMAAAIRETREEIGLELETQDCLRVGNLPERIVATTQGREALMVLCPFIFLLTSRTTPSLQPQPTEVASLHWVPLRALLSPSLRTLEYVDTSSRIGKRTGALLRVLLRITMGKMSFSAISLIPSESIYASRVPAFLPDANQKAEAVSGWAQMPYGVPQSSQSLAFQQPILLWGLTLGVLADFLDMLPPYNAVALWRYPTFTVPDLRFLVWLLTYRLRKNNAGDLSAGTWPKGVPWPGRRRRASNTAVDAVSQAVAINEQPTKMAENDTVGINGLHKKSQSGQAVARLMNGYYDRLNLAIGIFLVYRTMLAAGLLVLLALTEAPKFVPSAARIQAAWPTGAQVPSTRAISGRFALLRKRHPTTGGRGGDNSHSRASTQGTGRSPANPFPFAAPPSMATSTPTSTPTSRPEKSVETPKRTLTSSGRARAKKHKICDLSDSDIDVSIDDAIDTPTRTRSSRSASVKQRNYHLIKDEMFDGSDGGKDEAEKEIDTEDELSVNPQCVSAFNELKLGGSKGGLKYIIYKISDDQTEIVVDETGTEADYDGFREKLIAKKDKAGKDRPSYAIYDVEFELDGGEGKRSKIAFITYINQDNTAVKSRMVYASSRETLKNALNGIAITLQANDPSELEWADLLKEASKGKSTVPLFYPPSTMLLHSLPRAARTCTTSSRTCSRQLSNSIRCYQTTAQLLAPTFAASHQAPVTSQSQSRSAHAISNPTLAGIEKRWEGLPPQEQAELWMQLRDRMKVDWHELTLQEKKAAWWIAFGPHGPRAEDPPGEWSKVLLYSTVGVAISLAVFFGIHALAKPPPKSMTKEWQEATNEYLKSENVNPIYGISSEGYSGKGYVQSKSAKDQGIELDTDDE